MLDFVVPLLLIGLGAYFYFFTPTNQNQALSYRTKASLKSPEAFKRAHRYLGKLWLILGTATFFLYVALSFVPIQFFIRSSLFFVILLILLGLSILLTERKIKQ
ncbi:MULTISPECIES: SdpI family protein [Listeria]|uniref:SdpI family protein n=1 Tax=Listeria TaxID=1637 RepID=UPI000B588240|nr:MULTISPECIES: SdpI family protein [Listeria]